MSLFLSSYTKALRSYDRDLFAGRTKDGLACVFRRTKRFVPVCVDENFKLLNLVECKEFVFALTDNWTARGIPRDWGIDHVVSHVREIDSLANERFFEEMDERNEKVDQIKRKDIRNEMEGFWSYERKRFAKTMDESTGCLHSISMDEPKKRLKDRSIKNGNN